MSRRVTIIVGLLLAYGIGMMLAGAVAIGRGYQHGQMLGREAARRAHIEADTMQRMRDARAMEVLVRGLEGETEVAW